MPGSRNVRRSATAAIPLLLAALLLAQAPSACALDIGGVVSAVKGVFGGGGGSESNGGDSGSHGGSPASFGPFVVKTTRAAAALAGLGTSNTTAHTLPLGDAANVTLTKDRARPHSLELAFEAVPSLSSGGPTDTVPFLDRFAATAEAPAALLEAFMQAVEGPGTQGALADAAAELAGPDAVLHVVCTGAGPGGGGLALLCGPWAALQFPLANADVITFGADWAGFNTQLTWSFAQLVVLHYQWPFPLTAPPLAGALASRNGTAVAEALSSLITTDSLKQAVAVPRLPSPLPPDYSPSYTGEELGSLAPFDSELEPPPSDCPVILCKTRDAAAAACSIFDQGGEQKAFPGLPTARLHAANGADAVVAWNASSLTASIVWEGSEDKIDWVLDAILFFSDDFRPGNLSAVVPGVKVHKGFLEQHESFTTKPDSDQDNITAVLLGMSAGQQPQRIVAAGHSLGAALSELTGVWASTVWPEATVLVANTGAPRVGDGDWELEFTATVGRAFRYVNHLDQVPVLPPFDSFKQVPHGLWLRDNLVLLQDRPPLKRDQTTWDDHHCDTLYVPEILNASAVTVPGFILNATAA